MTEAPPSFRRFIALYLPLAFTFLLMTGSAPIVNAGITRMVGPAAEGLEVGGFALAFAMALFLHSPTFSIRDVALKSIRGRDSMRRVQAVCFAMAGLTMVLDLIVALTPLGDFMFRGIMGASEEMVARARPALLMFAPMPVLIVWRGIYQSVLIMGERARLLGLGTLIRLVVMALIAIPLGPYLGLSGASLGGLAFSAGILVEALCSTWWCRSDPRLMAGDEATATSIPDLLRLAMPLWLAGYLQVVNMPLIFRIINEMHNPADNVSAMELVKSIIWFLTSTVFSFQIVTVSWVRSRQHLRAVARFALGVALCLCGLLLVLALPPVRDLLLVRVMEVDHPRIRELVATALWIGLPFPLVVGIRAVLRGLVVVTGRTLWVTAATGLAMIPLLALVAAGWHRDAEGGAELGTLLWLGSGVVEVGILSVAMVWGGVWRSFAVEPATLGDHLDHRGVSVVEGQGKTVA